MARSLVRPVRGTTLAVGDEEGAEGHRLQCLSANRARLEEFPQSDRVRCRWCGKKLRRFPKVKSKARRLQV